MPTAVEVGFWATTQVAAAVAVVAAAAVAAVVAAGTVNVGAAGMDGTLANT